MNRNEDEHDQVGAYVLDALEPEERRAFEEHLRTCPECRAEVRELAGVADALALTAEPVEPPDGLRQRIMDAVAAEEDTRPQLTALPGGRPAPRRRSPWRLAEIVGLAAAVVLLVGLGLWNIRLQQNISRDRSALAYQRQVSRALAAGATVSDITGIGPGQGASAALVQPRGPKPAYLVVMNLPANRPNRVYELWLIRAHQAPVPARVFPYRGSAPEVVPLPMPAHGYSLAAVTIEPGPHGSKAPTGAKVLVGPIRV